MMVNSPPTSGDSALAILAAAADPKRTKAHIHEIMKVTQEMQDTLEKTREANREQEAIKKALDEGEANVSRREKELEQQVEEFNNSMSQRKAASEEVHQQAMQAYADAHQHLIAATEARQEAEKKLSELVSRETAVSIKEKAVSSREQDVSERESVVEDKMTKLRGLLG